MPTGVIEERYASPVAGEQDETAPPPTQQAGEGESQGRILAVRCDCQIGIEW